MPSFAVILPAAGKSRRFGDANYKKPFVHLAGRAVWMHAAEKFLSHGNCKQVILVIARDDHEDFNRRFGANVAILGVDVCEGGEERSDSVAAALPHIRTESEFVAVHDAARPCIALPWIDEVLAAAEKYDAAILATPVHETLKRVAENGEIVATTSRDDLWQAQTPQVFRRTLLIDAYASRGPTPATDDAELVERLGRPVHVVAGSPRNLKITTTEDIALAEQILKVLPKPKLDGPAHPFADGDLWR